MVLWKVPVPEKADTKLEYKHIFLYISFMHVVTNYFFVQRLVVR